MKTLLFAVLAVAALHLSAAHVRLTFPPARYPNYDFLDNVRTGGPCGVPDAEENDVVTTLVAGSTVPVSYRLAYPHRGGIRVNLLHENGTILYALLGLDGWKLDNNTTGYSHEVTLPPDFTCDRCVLQLVRQAAEWSAAGGYMFWSCADVSIQNRTDVPCDSAYCSGHGVCVNDECECDRLYYGEFCQFKDECEDASDCSNHGECVDLMGTTVPRKLCFCDAGFYGDACSEDSTLIDATIDEREYSLKAVLSDRLTVFAKIIDEEIEIALQHNGTGYVALGWKPPGLGADCRAEAPGSFPPGSHLLWPDGETWPMVAGADAFYTSLQTEGGEEEGGEEEGGEEEGGEEEGGEEEGGEEEGGEEEGGEEEGGEEEGGEEEGGEEEGGEEEGGEEEGGEEEGGEEEGGEEEGGEEEGGEEEGGEEEGGEEEGGEEEGGEEEGGEEEGGEEEGTTENIHPMDCADVVIAQARGERFRVYDYYTRDRSSPRRDSFYGGNDDITAAVGNEVDGITSIKFRRQLSTGDENADHVITNSIMRVIWSFGQVYPDYFHWPASGIESGLAPNDRFYQPDEIKYHGTRNRGGTSINFFDETTEFDPAACTGGFNTSCNAQGVCEYKATWTVRGNSVDFVVSAQVTLGQWVGIGFSDDTFMPASDVIVGAVGNSGYFVTDRYATAYAPPPVDVSQDITSTRAEHSNGVTTIYFRRPLVANDDDDISLNECRYFLFGWGGDATIETQEIGYHPTTPIVSQERICLPSPANCPADDIDEETAGAAMTTVSALTIATVTLVTATLT